MRPLILVFLSVLSFNGYAGQANSGSAKPPADHVIIQRRRIVLVRSRELAKQFPDRKRAIITYPVVSGVSNRAVLSRVRSALAFKNLFDYSLSAYRNDSWLSEFTYVVNYNSNYILDITFTQSGMAAYPDEQSKHLLINLRDGHIVKALDVFESGKLNSLAALVNRELQREIKQITKENAESNATEPDVKEAISGAHENLRFEVENLQNFSVGRKGVTFLYDAGFPHVIKAVEPGGRYFFSYSALSEYIKHDRLLGRFQRLRLQI